MTVLVWCDEKACRNSLYCETHECIHDECNRSRVSWNSYWCEMHDSEYSRCTNAKIEGSKSKYCDVHEAIMK